MKKMRNLKSSLWFVATFALISSITWSCKDDEETPATVNIDNPNEVSKALVIENSTFVSGNPPAPSLSETAPVLEEYSNGESVLSIQGSKIIFNAYVESGSASGFYVQVEGANGYYKTNSTSATGRLGSNTKARSLFNSGRKQEGDASFSIEIPENIQPGEFCISYCVYDAQNQVSNIIEQCIIVTTIGGENSSFLTANKWEFVKNIEYENNVAVYTSLVGVPEVYEYESWSFCNDEEIMLNVSEEYLTDYLYLTLTTNGGLLIESKYTDKYLDWENTTCEPIYITETETEKYDGAWSYDHSTKTLILLYNIEEEEGVETEAISFKTEVVDGQLLLTNEFEEYRDVTYLKVKN